MTKVLYVEDEPFLAKIVKESLESRNYSVRWVEDGAKVLSAFNAFNPDICLLDVMLPNKDGFQIAQEIIGIHDQIPIIFLTAKDQIDDLKKGFSAGGRDYLTKPFSIEELILRIENLLRLFNGSASISYEEEKVIGDYHYFPTKMILRYHDTSYTLSHRENEILKLLVSSVSQVVSRKEILDQVWGNDSFFNSRNLDVYIKKLRDYLKLDTSIKIITLKGVGYRFVWG